MTPVICHKQPRSSGLGPAARVMLYGDSRFSTDYTWAKDAFQDLTGAECYNGGYSGKTVAFTALDQSLARIWDYAPMGPVIYLPGGNDMGAAGEVGTFDGSVLGEPLVEPTNINADFSGEFFIQAVDHTVRKVLAYCASAQAGDRDTGRQEDTPGPYAILCTDIPQQRHIDPRWGSAASWNRKRAAIAEVGRRHRVHTVDTMADLGWDMRMEPTWNAPTDLNANRGVFTLDGVHPNERGMRQLVELICKDAGLVRGSAPGV